MARKRRVLSSQFKAKVAMAAAKEDQTLSALASKFAVHSNQVPAWKKTLVERVAELFEDGRMKTESGPSTDDWFAQIGRLQVELEWLKKRRVCRLRLGVGGLNSTMRRSACVDSANFWGWGDRVATTRRCRNRRRTFG
ncbi:hypothetical protein [Fimbriiglobus ruber]|uniref:Mobile element protein n=1 Tax=Fimbriiglobus ruber TaxID=1908690 RepID=A0A225DUQ4_9BACT|nr:hypothetical protein [Fimbriiglobus ruber]OWK42268.1 Mobile element protein [Fimbriiglobus ruber]